MSFTRMLRHFVPALVIGASITISNPEASAQIINTANIEELCRTAPVATYRRTLVYVDLSSVKKEKTDWGLTILNRLELGAREHLTILSVNPSSFEIGQVFDLCYPIYTKKEIEGARTGRGIWDKLLQLDPVDQQRENLQTFDARLRNSLDRVINDAAKYEQGKRRNILGAIAFDKNRYSERNALCRIIIYTDGILIDSGLEPGVAEQQQVKVLTEKSPASFSAADVSVFGLASANDKDTSLEAKERIFSAFFLNSWSHLKSFSSSLPQQSNGMIPAVNRMDGVFDGGGAQGSAKLVVTTLQEGPLAEGWLAFNIGRANLYVPYQGEFRCENGDCRLTATATESVPPLSATSYFRKGDKLFLRGKAVTALEGTLQAGGKEVFKDGTQEVKYNLNFIKP